VTPILAVLCEKLAEPVDPVERGQNLFGDGFGTGGGFALIRTEIGQYHDEFIAAESGDGIALAHTLYKARCDLLQKLVTDVMAERVVEVLKIIPGR